MSCRCTREEDSRGVQVDQDKVMCCASSCKFSSVTIFFLPCTCLMVPRLCCTDLFVIFSWFGTHLSCLRLWFIPIDCPLFWVWCTCTIAAITDTKTIQNLYTLSVGLGWEGTGRAGTGHCHFTILRLVFSHCTTLLSGLKHFTLHYIACFTRVEWLITIMHLHHYHHASSSIVLTHCKCLAGVQGRKIHEVYELTKAKLCVVRFHVHFQV